MVNERDYDVPCPNCQGVDIKYFQAWDTFICLGCGDFRDFEGFEVKRPSTLYVGDRPNPLIDPMGYL